MLTDVMRLRSSCLFQGPLSFWPCEGRPGDAAVRYAHNTRGAFQQSQMSTVPTPAGGGTFCSAASAPQSDGDFGPGFLTRLPNISQSIKAGNKFYQTGLVTGS